MAEQGASDVSPAVTKVFANVRMRSEAKRRETFERLRERHEARDPERFKRIGDQLLSPERYEVLVSLSAELRDGSRIYTPGTDFAISGQRWGIGAIWHRYRGPRLPDGETERRAALARYHVGPWDIESAIDQMLGRDAEQHRPPRLSWENLIKALGDEGIVVNDDDLITAPLAIEFDHDVKLLLDEH